MYIIALIIRGIEGKSDIYTVHCFVKYSYTCGLGANLQMCCCDIVLFTLANTYPNSNLLHMDLTIYLSWGFQSHRHLQGNMATSSFNWWKRNFTYEFRNAELLLRIKVFVATRNQTNAASVGN